MKRHFRTSAVDIVLLAFLWQYSQRKYLENSNGLGAPQWKWQLIFYFIAPPVSNISGWMLIVFTDHVQMDLWTSLRVKKNSKNNISSLFFISRFFWRNRRAHSALSRDCDKRVTNVRDKLSSLGADVFFGRIEKRERGGLTKWKYEG